jgi:hypothetical protein
VTRGKGARTPFRQRPWQPDILGRLSARGAATEAGLDFDAERQRNQRLKEPSFPQHLLRLAERAEGVVPAVVGPRTDEETAVVGARNDIAHSLDRGWLEERRLDQ